MKTQRLRAVKILLSLLTLAALAWPAVSSASIGPAATGNTGPVTWTNIIPFSPSPTYSGVTFTGPWASYTGGSSQGADTWYPSWASDDKLYSTYMDGSCDGQYANGQNLPATLGLATISGSDPMNLSISCHVIGRNHTNFQGPLRLRQPDVQRRVVLRQLRAERRLAAGRRAVRCAVHARSVPLVRRIDPRRRRRCLAADDAYDVEPAVRGVAGQRLPSETRCVAL